ncbi:MAG: VOC family protein [Caulobacteraceae bacterium]|nr:VOC family protein [Caulobacteraceae bacterium]
MALITPAYHFGIVVRNIERAQAELSELLGLHWHRAIASDGLRDTPEGVKLINSRFCYSKEGPPYFELLEQRPGTIWEKTGLHHIGVWTDDFHAESARFDACGCPRASVTIAENGEWRGGCYHTTSDGLHIELVNIGTSGPRLARYLNGGGYE